MVLGKLAETTALLLFLALFASAAPGEIEFTGSKSSVDYSGFTPQVNLANVKFCSNEPTGAYCENWAASCNQITQTTYGAGYYAYFDAMDVIHNGKYDYLMEYYGWKPDGTQFSQQTRDTGYNAVGYRCWKIQFTGGYYSTPAGNWRYLFRLNDYVTVTGAEQNANLLVTCTSNSQCPANTACVNSQCAPQGDLQAYDITISPEKPLANLDASYTSWVKNTGSARLPTASKVLNTEFNSDGQYVHNAQWNAFDMNIGDVVTQYAHQTLAAGLHTIKIKTNPGNTIEEIRYDNNEFSRTWEWKVDKPDLQVTSLIVNPEPPVGGQTATVLATIKDYKNRDIYARSLLEIYIDGKKEATYNAYAVPAMGVTAKHYVTLPPGTHTIKATIDSTNLIDEIDEANNENVKAITWITPAPITQELTGLESEYYVGDTATATITVKNADGTLLSDAEITVRNTQTTSAAKLYTDANGQAAYSFNVTANGPHYLEIYSRKQGYSTAWQKFHYKAIDYNARIHAFVHDANNKPIKNARIIFKNNIKTTDANGTALILASKGFNKITVQCPDATFCTERPVNVQNTSYENIQCKCKTGSLKVSVESESGRPIANALVILDGNEFQYTNGWGYTYFTGENHGQHKADVWLNATGPNPGLYQAAVTLNLNSTLTEVVAKANLSSGSVLFQGADVRQEVKFRQHNATVVPLIIAGVVVALEVIDVLSIAYDVAEACKCAARTAGDENEFVNQCTIRLASCAASTQTIPVPGAHEACQTEIRRLMDNDFAGKCWPEMGFLAVDVGTPLVPLGAIKAGVIGLPAVAKTIKYGDKTIAGLQILEKADAVTMPLRKWQLVGDTRIVVDDASEMVFRKIDGEKYSTEILSRNLHTNTWSKEAQNGWKLLSKDGEQALLKKLAGHSEETIKLTAEAAGKNIFNPNTVPAEKVAEIFKHEGNVFGNNNAEAIVKIFKTDDRITLEYGANKIQGLAILREGTEGYGKKHIRIRHINTPLNDPENFFNAYKGKIRTEEAVFKLIDETVAEGKAALNPDTLRWEIGYKPFANEKGMIVVFDPELKSIITAFPDNYGVIK